MSTRGFKDSPARVRDAGLGLEPIDLNGLVMADLLERVAHMPAHTVLFLFSTPVDAAGRAFQPMRACELVAAAANRPLFSLQRHELGCGITGGLLQDMEVAGRVLGERALVILDGELTAGAIVPAEQYSALVFDARQLQRWHIDERRLPAGSTLQFQEPSLWRDYRAQVVAISGIAVLQTVLLAWLLFEQRRRRRAEVDSGQLLEAARGRELTIAHLDRRAAIGEVTTAITHELNQPLEAILHNAEAAEMLLDSGKASESELREILADIRRIDARAGAIVQRMRGLLRKKEFETQPIDLNELTRDTVAFVMPVAGSKGVRLGLDTGGGPRTDCRRSDTSPAGTPQYPSQRYRSHERDAAGVPAPRRQHAAEQRADRGGGERSRSRDSSGPDRPDI